MKHKDRIDLEPRSSKSLLYIRIDKQRLLSGLDDLSGVTGLSQSKLTKILILDEAYGQRCPAHVRQPVLDYIRKQISSLCPNDEELAVAVSKIFTTRFAHTRDAGYVKTFAEANKNLPPPPQKQEPHEDAPSKSEASEEPTTEQTTEEGPTFDTPSETSSEAPAEECKARHVVFLLPEANDFNVGVNNELRSQLHFRFQEIGFEGVEFKTADSSLERTKRLARELLELHEVKTVQWLSLVAVGLERRIHFSSAYLAPQYLESDSFEDFAERALSLRQVDHWTANIFGAVLMYEIVLYNQEGRTQDAEALIARGYRANPLLVKKQFFAEEEAHILAVKGELIQALAILDRSAAGWAKTIDVKSGFIDATYGHDYRRAQILFRLGRYEQAFVTLTKGRMDGRRGMICFNRFDLVTVPPGLAIFRLNYPIGCGAMIRFGGDCLAVFDRAFDKGLDEGFYDPDKRDGLIAFAWGLSWAQDNKPYGKGLYYAGPDSTDGPTYLRRLEKF